MKEQLKQAALCNNSALSLLLCSSPGEDVQAACGLFSQTLEMCKNASGDIGRSSSDSSTTTTKSIYHDCHDISRSLDRYMGNNVPSFDCLEACHLIFPDHETVDSSLYVYSKGIFLPENIADDMELADIIQLISCAVVFNLALYYHFFPAKNTSVQTRCRKALQLYKLGLCLLRDSMSMQTQGDVLFTLATINNIAIIQKAVNPSSVQGQRNFEYLLTSLLPSMMNFQSRSSPAEEGYPQLPDAVIFSNFTRNAVTALSTGSRKTTLAAAA